MNTPTHVTPQWIKIRRGLRHDPKVAAMARHLCNSPKFIEWLSMPMARIADDWNTEQVTNIVTFPNVMRITVCGLVDVWASLNGTINTDGNAPYLVLDDIDEIAEIPGFGAAMEHVGWAAYSKSQGIDFPNFTEFNSPTKPKTKLPATDAERSRKYRAKKKEATSVTASRNDTCRKEKKEEDENDKKTERAKKKTISSLSSLAMPVTIPGQLLPEDRKLTVVPDDFDKITKKLNRLDPRWSSKLSNKEIQALKLDMPMLLAIADEKWDLLESFFHAIIPPETQAMFKFYRPQSREKAISDMNDILVHADTWKRALAESGKPIPLPPSKFKQ